MKDGLGLVLGAVAILGSFAAEKQYQTGKILNIQQKTNSRGACAEDSTALFSEAVKPQVCVEHPTGFGILGYGSYLAR